MCTSLRRQQQQKKPCDLVAVATSHPWACTLQLRYIRFVLQLGLLLCCSESGLALLPQCEIEPAFQQNLRCYGGGFGEKFPSSLHRQAYTPKSTLRAVVMGTTSDNNLPINVHTREKEGDIEALPGLTIKADGTVLRNNDRVPPSPNFVDGVASKDVTIDPETSVWARVFLPELATTAQTNKLPVVVFFHGGGFCMGNPGGESPTNESKRICKAANVVVVCAGYRLAPENRLPIAYNDGYTTLLWLQKQCLYQASGEEPGEPWLINNANFSQVFVMGVSAGGNVVHHLVVLKPLHELAPLSIKGVIPVVPFFSAEAQSHTEKLFADDAVLPTAKHMMFWKLCLPLGANRDHPYCNILSSDAPNLADVPFPNILLIVAGKDPLNTRQIEYYNALKKAGKNVELVEVPEGTHTFRKSPHLEADNVRVTKVICEFIQNYSI